MSSTSTFILVVASTHALYYCCLLFTVLPSYFLCIIFVEPGLSLDTSAANTLLHQSEIFLNGNVMSNFTCTFREVDSSLPFNG